MELVDYENVVVGEVLEVVGIVGVEDSPNLLLRACYV